jgi:RHS repeat-associated protein
VAIELPGYVITAFNVVGLPWPGIDEDQLRAWANSVRAFAGDTSGNSTRMRQSIAELAEASDSAFVNSLVAGWERHHQIITELHEPMMIFAEALDDTAYVVEVQKGAVITAAAWLAGEFVSTQIGAIFTLGADEMAVVPEVLSTREAVKLALNYLEGELMGKLIGIAVQDISGHLSRSLANMLDVGLPVVGEVQSLKMSYSALRGSAEKVSGHATESENTGDDAYRENANRNLEDSSEGGDDAGDGGGWKAVLRAVEQALLDLARLLFKTLAESIARIEQAFSGAIKQMIAKLIRTDEDDGFPGEGSSGPTGMQDNSTGSSGADTARSGTSDRQRETVKASEKAGSGKSQGECTQEGDPVDVATGDVVLAETDVTLPGVLPLVLERTHRSSWRTGHWFGRSWLSTFDQRLQIAADRVIGVFADGRLLTWAHPDGPDGTSPLPLRGPAWPLRRNPDGSYAVTDPQRGLTWRFDRRVGYDVGPGEQGELPLVSLTDRVGHEIVFSYDASGQPLGVTHSGGYRVLVTMADDRLTGLTLAGRDGEDDVVLRRFTYDLHGNLSGVINSSGLPLRYSYDSADRLTGWEDRNGHYYRYTYDSEGRCLSGEGPGGALSGTFTYEPGVTRWTTIDGATTTYEVTESGNVSATTDPLGNVTRSEYDSRNQLTTQIDPLGRITRYAYDSVGNITTVTRPDGSQAHAEYDDRGLLTTLAAPDETIWRQEHDALGNRTALIAPDVTVTRFAYDPAGHLASITDPVGAVTRVENDAAGLPVAVTSPMGSPTQYGRDAFGRVTEVTAPDGAVTGLSWTTEGRLAGRSFPDGASENWTYDGEGNLISQLSPVGAVTAYEYGPFDRPTAMTGPDGTRTEFACDHELRLTSVVYGGLTWRYEYDAAGRLASETDYNAATTTYAYDPAGQLTNRLNAVAQQVAFRYDQLGNQVERIADGVVTTFEYDAADRLTRAANPDVDLRFEFDALGQVIAETCNGRAVTSQYDPAARLARRVTPSGTATDWQYDLDGQPVLMTTGGHELRFGYDQSGRETRRDLPGGLTLTQDWDQRGRLTLQALAGTGSPLPEGPATPGQLLQRRSYRYRPDGLVTGIDDLLVGNRTIGLDRAGRVTTVTGQNWSEQYAYDHAGNVTTASWPAPPSGPAASWLNADSQGQRDVTGTLIRRAGNIRYRHDPAGRVTQRQRTRISRKPDTWHYEWDPDDRLTAVTTPDGTTWRYRYDPFGRRIAKEHLSLNGDVTERTVFAWDGPLLVEQAATPVGASQGAVLTWNYGPGTFTPLTQAEQTSLRDATQAEIDQRFYAIVTDLVGTPTELTAPDGTISGHQIQTLWGGTTWTSDDAKTPLRFPGQYEDQETGLHYNNQRYYDPVTGSYLTSDPLGLAPTPNPHTYVLNPQARTDPLGLTDYCTVNAAGQPYPTVVDPRTGNPIPPPPQGLTVVDPADRVKWGQQERYEYIKAWHDLGYPRPTNGWGKYDIHHIIPREYGGTNHFDNLVPVLRQVHQDEFNEWWRNYD